MAVPKPVMLCVLDGWGLAPDGPYNAVTRADTPVFDRIMAGCPSARLDASGEAVGLPVGQIGNSEVGHTTIGAGRIVWQDLPRITRAIEEGELDSNAVLQDFISKLKSSGGTAHLLGLVSDGGVHSHLGHVEALAKSIAGAGVPVALHILTDGRDVGPRTGLGHVETLLNAIDGIDLITPASISGRYYTMDRDKRWERIEQGFRIIRDAAGRHADDALTHIRDSYAEDVTDEFIPPAVLGDYTGMSAGDGLIAANFRADRMRQILTAFVDPDFDGFEDAGADLAATAGMVTYSDALAPYIPALFEPQEISKTLGETVARAGRRQFRLAETEKYAHVTYFLNGGAETPFEGETRKMAQSPKVATYDLQPEMSAPEVGKILAEAISTGDHDLVVVNFANPDMVGHTGSIKAAISACEAVDAQLGLALEALEQRGGAALVTADHGNCEQMWDEATNGPHTAHTLNKVPVILVGSVGSGAALRDGGLSDLAPTVLDLMGLDQPDEMTGSSLLSRAPASVN
ncbi:MAG: 2,3-bisphosphoglycerate-independent phosphoglycerate mutase [Alphaproteobacteria bacterium]